MKWPKLCVLHCKDCDDCDHMTFFPYPWKWTPKAFWGQIVSKEVFLKPGSPLQCGTRGDAAVPASCSGQAESQPGQRLQWPEAHRHPGDAKQSQGWVWEGEAACWLGGPGQAEETPRAATSTASRRSWLRKKTCLTGLSLKDKERSLLTSEAWTWHENLKCSFSITVTYCWRKWFCSAGSSGKASGLLIPAVSARSSEFMQALKSTLIMCP